MSAAAEPRAGVDTLKLGPRRRDGTAMALVVREPTRLRRVVLPPRGCLLVGRDDEADVMLETASVSRRHARIFGGELPGIEDLGSTNGTWVNGRRLDPGRVVLLEEGSSVKLGDALAVVERLDLESQAVVPQGPDEVVVVSACMRAVHDRVRLFARSSCPILILGETGVGKEVYASVIVAMSPRASRPFLRLNCAALPGDMVESELFGHERGAFTGAVASKSGLLESADGGTVLLDEAGELTLGTQAKLLRALESGEILRLGSLKTRKVDVRVLAATNRDLGAMVREGSFRADLYYRLAGAEVTLPPLRERLEDMESLTSAFVQRACTALGFAPVAVTAPAMRRLLDHSWPGNVRELKSTIERAVLVAQGSEIREEHITFVGHPRAAGAPPAITEQLAAIELVRKKPAEPHIELTRRKSPAEPPAATSDFYRERREREKASMIAALEACDGNQTQAALHLGMPRRTFVKRLTEYGIRTPRRADVGSGED